MSTISYKPLNLYRQFKTAAQEFPNVAIYFDKPYASFPELGLEIPIKQFLKLFKKELPNLQQQVLAMGTR
ncbi:Acyl-coenzyme A synthetases/AMP-(fatty) acid ligase [Streptococcus suis]|nr:Acyl-coenzyme A synthetases/AMP-(fatty) acid ligase [Streptococcus suis]